MPTRRAALLTIAGAAATPLLSKQSPHMMAAEEPAAALSLEPVYFNHADYAVVTRLADLIIPRTDTPGAVDARVPFRIDHEVHASPRLQETFRVGLASLPADFLALTEAQQVSTLQAMHTEPFFDTIKGLTVEWYYRSEEGLVRELGFHGNTYRTDFPGCTHPEHWPSSAQETK